MRNQMFKPEPLTWNKIQKSKTAALQWLDAHAEALWSAAKSIHDFNDVPVSDTTNSTDISGFSDYLQRRARSKPMIKYMGRVPGVKIANTGSPQFRKFQDEVLGVLEASLPKVKLDEFGVGQSWGCTHSFDDCRYLQGFGMDPTPSPLLNQTVVAKIRGLPVWTERQVKVAFMTCLTTFILGSFGAYASGQSVRPLGVTKTTSSGGKRGLKGEAKVEGARRILSEAESFGSKWKAGDLRAIYDEHDLCFVSLAGSRTNQSESLVDGRPKARSVLLPQHWADVLSGDISPDYFVDANRDVTDEVQKVASFPKLYANRVRMIYNLEWFASLFESGLIEPMRTGLKALYPDTMAYTGPEWMSALTTPFKFKITYDASQFDESNGPQYLAAQAMAQAMAVAVHWVSLDPTSPDFLPVVKELFAYFRKLAHCPFLLASTSRNFDGHLVAGDPFSKDSLVFTGMPSGKANVSISNTQAGLTSFMLIYEHLLGSNPESPRDIAAFFELDNKFGVTHFQFSDDGLSLTNNKALALKLKAVEELPRELTLFKWNYQQQAGVLGFFLFNPSVVPPSVAERFKGGDCWLVSNLAPLRKLFLSEDDWHAKSADPTNFAVGWRAAYELYAKQCVMFSEVWDIACAVSTSYGMHLASDLLGLSAALGGTTFNNVDLEVLADPEKLSWKYSVSDVSDSVRDMLTTTVTVAELQQGLHSFLFALGAKHE